MVSPFLTQNVAKYRQNAKNILITDSQSTTNAGQTDVTLQNASTHSLRICNSESSALQLSAHHHTFITA